MDLWSQSVLVAALSEPRSTSKKQTQTESTEVPGCHIVTVSPGASGRPHRRQSHTQRQQRRQGGVMATMWIKGLAPVWSPEFAFICSYLFYLLLLEQKPQVLLDKNLLQAGPGLSPPCPHALVPSAQLPSQPPSPPHPSGHKLGFIPVWNAWNSQPPWVFYSSSFPPCSLPSRAFSRSSSVSQVIKLKLYETLDLNHVHCLKFIQFTPIFNFVLYLVPGPGLPFVLSAVFEQILNSQSSVNSKNSPREAAVYLNFVNILSKLRPH